MKRLEVEKEGICPRLPIKSTQRQQRLQPGPVTPPEPNLLLKEILITRITLQFSSLQFKMHAQGGCLSVLDKTLLESDPWVIPTIMFVATTFGSLQMDSIKNT